MLISEPDAAEATKFCTPPVGVPICMFNVKRNVPSVGNCPTNTLFVVGTGPVEPPNAATDPLMVENELETLLVLLNTSSAGASRPTNVTATGVPAIIPSCVVKGIPAYELLFNKTGSPVIRFEAPSSSDFRIPKCPFAAAPTENQESSATVLSFINVEPMLGVVFPLSSLLKKEVVVFSASVWPGTPYNAWKL